jgi:hypothetical protein
VAQALSAETQAKFKNRSITTVLRICGDPTRPISDYHDRRGRRATANVAQRIREAGQIWAILLRTGFYSRALGLSSRQQECAIQWISAESRTYGVVNLFGRKRRRRQA